MKKTIFSRGLYLESLRRLRVLGFIALAVLLLMQLAPAIVQIFDYYTYQDFYLEQEKLYGSVAEYTPQTVNASVLFFSVPFNVIFVTPIMVLLVFSVFNKRASSDFYHALPYTRPCIFLSSMAAVLTWVVSISVISSVLGTLSYIAFPNIFTVIFDGAGELILTYIALFLLTAGGTALAVGATGTALSNLCVTFLVLFLPRFIMTIMTTWITNAAEFLVLNEAGSSFLSYDINVLFGTVAGLFMFGGIPDYSSNYIADIYSIVLGLIYLSLALFVFVKRKSETATQPAPGRAVQHVIRIMLTMVVGIFSTILFIEGEWAGFVIVSIITAIVYFAYELITTHRWNNLLKALPYYGVVIVLCIICGAVIICVPKIASQYTPDSDEIDSVRLLNNDYGYNDDWFGADAQKLELTDETIIKTVSETLKKNMEVYNEKGYVGSHNYEILIDSAYPYKDEPPAIAQTVAIKEGIVTKYRTLFFSQEDYSTVLQALEKNEKYIESCKTLPTPAKNSLDFSFYDKDVDYSYCEQIFKCLQKEIDTLSFEEWYNVANYTNYDYTEYTLWYYSDDYDSKFVEIPISSNIFPKTFEMLLETDKIDHEERYAELKKIISDDEFAEREDLLYISVDVAVRMPESDGEHAYYLAHSDYSNSWKNNIYRDAFIDMLNKVEACDSDPDSESYILVTYHYETPDDFENDEIYLPLPEDFDPESWDFEERLVSEEYYYEYR